MTSNAGKGFSRLGGGLGRARLALVAGAVTLLGCSHGKAPQVTPPPLPALHVTRMALHWNDAADTTRVLTAPSHRPFRTDLTITGLADSLQGFRIIFRLEPLANQRGTCFAFADTGNCLGAVWAGTAGADPKARAPWPNKLLITDVRPQPDGSVVFIVGAAFDMVAMHPDSVYSLCHMDFQPPESKSDSVSCAGWDTPARLYVEDANVLLSAFEQPVYEVGRPILFQPRAEPDTSSRRR